MIEHTKKYVDTLYDPDELLSIVMLNGGRAFGRTSIGFYRTRPEPSSWWSLASAGNPSPRNPTTGK